MRETKARVSQDSPLQQLEAMLLPDTELPTTLKRQDGSSIPWS